MLKWWIFLFTPLLLACGSQEPVDFNELDISFLHDIPKYELNGAPFTGVAIEEFSELKVEHHIKTGYEQKQIGYYLSGDKEREFNFKDGKKHGQSTLWYKDGTLRVEETFVDGELNGEVKQYNFDGTLKESKNYVNGILELRTDSTSDE